MSQVPVVSLTDERAPSLEVALKSKSGLAIGTRAALSLCDRVDIGMVGWIDADGEARSQEYDSRARAFGLVWESRWRGTAESSGKRLILLQTRRPSRDWQRGFENDGPNKPGWEIFWRGELRERREFSMPPFVSLIKIEANPQDISAMMEKFDDAHLEYWLADSPEGTIWLRTNNLSSLRSALAPFFSIKRVSRVKGGYPTITINHE
jgi:primosomal protein N' (replication factor Y)